MSRTSSLILLLGLCLCLQQTQAKLIIPSQQKCSIDCYANYNTNGFYKYLQTYIYTYKSSIEMNHTNQNKLEINAQIQLSAISKCEITMQLLQVEVLGDLALEDIPNAKKIQMDLEKYQVYFNQADNQLNSICMHPDEPDYVRNIKKSIIDKVKYQSNAYKGSSFETETQSPVSKWASSTGKTRCNYNYDRNGLVNVICLENILIKNEFGKESFFVNAATTIELRETNRNINAKQDSLVPTDMEYQSIGSLLTDKNIDKSLKLLNDYVANKNPQSKASLFIQLVNQLKQLSEQHLIQLNERIQVAVKSKASRLSRVYFDAIGYVNTPESISFVVPLIQTGSITDIDRTLWLSSLVLMQTPPTESMLASLATLIDTKSLSNQFYITIGSLVNRFCQSDYNKCQKSATISNIINKLMGPLGDECQIDNTDTQALISLKSLDNAKFYNERLVKVLGKCVESSNQNKMSLKIAALKVLKHMGCEYDRNNLFELLKDPKQDSELRINAYLAYMGCKSLETLTKVFNLLKEDKNNQVGSFIWSHLQNLKSFPTEDLQNELKILMSDEYLQKEFDLSKLKYSRNWAKSFDTKYGLLQVDSNVIFSEKSFVPRSVSINSSTVIFNKNQQILEVQSRFEGLEEVLFKLMGPDGYMKTKKIDGDVLKLLQEINGNVDVKILGQQLSILELMKGQILGNKKYDMWTELKSIGDEKSITIDKRMILMDSSIEVMTSVGIPLKLSIQSSADVDMKVRSKLDLDGIMQRPMSFSLDNYFSPEIQAVAQIEASIYTPYLQQGLQYNIRSYGNSDVKTSLKFNKDKEFSVEINTPKSSQAILSIDSEIFLIRTDRRLKVDSEFPKKSSEQCFGQLLGYKACYGLTRSTNNNKILPVFRAAFGINKIDSSQTGVVLRFKDENQMNLKGNRQLIFEFDTPKSKVNRRIFGEMKIDLNKRQLKVEVEAGKKHAKLELYCDLESLEKKIGMNLEINKKSIFQVMGEHVNLLGNNHKSIKGGLSLNMYDFQPIELKYSWIKSNKKFTLKLYEKGLFKKPMGLKLDILKDKQTRALSLYNKFKVIGSYKTHLGDGKISGIASENFYGHRWDVKLNHNNQYNIIFRHKTEDKSSKTLRKYFLTSSINYGKNAENFYKIHSENELSSRHIRSLNKWSFGDAVKSDKLKLHIYTGVQEKPNNRQEIEGVFDFKYPKKSINYEGGFEGHLEKRSVKLNIKFDQNKIPYANFHLDYQQPQMYLKDTIFTVKSSIAGHNTQFKWLLKEVDVSKYQYEMSSSWNTYVMNVRGTQLQIAQRNYQSDIEFEFPLVGNLPKSAQINLKLNLKDLKNSLIFSKLTVPDYKINYEINTDMQIDLDNFMRKIDNFKTLRESPIIKYNIKLNRNGKMFKKRLFVACNSQQIKFITEWNKDWQLALNMFHTRPTYRQLNSQIDANLKYPGNYHAIKFKSDWNNIEMQSQLDINWNINRNIAINTMYKLDNSWTQKGLIASITVKTPFVGYEKTHFGINAHGELLYRKIQIELNYNKNKKLALEFIVQPKSVNDFTMSAKLITPWQGWTSLGVTARHLMTQSSISSEATVELGVKQTYTLKFESLDNSQSSSVIDYKVGLSLKSAGSAIFQIHALHKSDINFYQSEFKIKLLKSKYIEIKSTLRKNFDQTQKLIKSDLELNTNIQEIPELQLKLFVESNKELLTSNFELRQNSAILCAYKFNIYYSRIEATNSYRLDIDLSVQHLNYAQLKLKGNALIKLGDFSLKSKAKLIAENIEYYSHDLTLEKNTVNLLIELPTCRKYKAIKIYDSWKDQDLNKVSRELYIKVDNKYVMKTTILVILQNLPGKSINIDATIKTTSDLFSWIEHRGQIKLSANSKSGKLSVEFMRQKKLVLSINGDFQATDETLKKFTIIGRIKTSFDQMKSLYFEMDQSPKRGRKPMVNRFLIKHSSNRKLAGSFELRNLDYFKVDVKWTGINGEKTREFFLKHGNNLMGFNDELRLNLFGENVNYICSYNVRGGNAFHARLKTSFERYLKSIDVIQRSSRFDQQIDFIYATNYELTKISYRQRKQMFEFAINTRHSINTGIKIYTSNWNKIHVTFDYKPSTEFQIDYEWDETNGKYLTFVKLVKDSWRFELKNKLEMKQWSSLSIESELKQTFNENYNYNLGFKYQLRPNDFQARVSVNKFFVETNLKYLNNVEKDMLLKLESSEKWLKLAEIQTKFKLNKAARQFNQVVKIALKSQEMSIKLDKKIEIAGWNYINIAGEVEIKMDDSSYVIYPKKMQLLHQMHNAVYNEKVFFSWNKQKQFDLELTIPKKLKSTAKLSVECSKHGKILGELKYEWSNIENMELLVKLERNDVTVFMLSSRSLKSHMKIVYNHEMIIGKFFSHKLKGLTLEKSDDKWILSGDYTTNLLMNPFKLLARWKENMKQLNLELTHEDLYQVEWDLTSVKSVIMKVKLGKYKFIGNAAYLNQKELNCRLTLNLGETAMCSLKFDLQDEKFMFKLKSQNEFLLVKMGRSQNRLFISGESSQPEWEKFLAQVDLSDNQLQSQIEVGQKLIYKLLLKQDPFKSLSFTQESVCPYLQLVEFDFQFGNAPRNMNLQMKLNYRNSEQIKMLLQLENGNIQGSFVSTFKNFKDLKLSGQLNQENSQIVSSELKITSSEWTKEIYGSVDIKSNQIMLKFNSPFSEKTKEFIVKFKLDKSPQNIELVYDGVSVLSGYRNLHKTLILDGGLAVNWNNLQMETKLKLDLINKDKSMRFELKSNKFETITLQWKFNWELCTGNMHLNSALVVLKWDMLCEKNLMKFKFEVNDLPLEFRLEHQLEDIDNVKLKFILENIYQDGITYSHKLDRNNGLFSMNFQIQDSGRNIVKYQSELSRDMRGIMKLTWKDYDENQMEFTTRKVKLSLPSVWNKDVEWKLTEYSANKIEMTFESPFDLMKSIRVRWNIVDPSGEYQLYAESNKLGSITIDYVYKYQNNNQLQIESRVSIGERINMGVVKINYLRNKRVNLLINLYDKKLNMEVVYTGNSISIQIESNIKYWEKMELSMVGQTANSFLVSGQYNDKEITVTVGPRGVTIKSNLPQIQVIEMSWEQNLDQYKWTLVRNNNKIHVEILYLPNKKFTYKLTNDLFEFLPNQQMMNYEWDKFELTNNNKRILLTSYSPYNSFVFLLDVLDIKIDVELIDNKVNIMLFHPEYLSVKIPRFSRDSFEGTLVLQKELYSFKYSFDYPRPSKIDFKFDLFRGTNEKVVQVVFKQDFNGIIQLIQGHIKYQNDLNLLNVKIIQKDFNKKIALIELWKFEVQLELSENLWSTNAKKYLVVKWKIDQLHQGSIEVKFDGANVVLSIMNKSDQYLMEYSMTEDVYKFIMKTPIKSLDLLINIQHRFRLGKFQGCECLLANSYLGKYQMKLVMEQDQMSLLIQKDEYKWIELMARYLYPTSSKLEVEVAMKFAEFDKIEMISKLSYDNLIEIEFELKTPMKHLKHLRLKKSIMIEGWAEYRLDGEVHYLGMKRMIFVGKHEVSWSKKIWRFDSNFKHEMLQEVSFKIDHKGGWDKLTHSVELNFGENKYGYKLDGSMSPLFVGTTEIYTPRHNAGKLVFNVDRKPNEAELSLTDGEGEVQSSIKYIKSMDNVQLIKIQPPRSFKPIDLQFSSQRSISGVSFQTNVKYGLEELFDLESKIEMDKNKFQGNFFLKSPFISNEQASLNLEHQKSSEEPHYKFNHNLNFAGQLYNLQGQLLMKDRRNFKIYLNSKLPKFGESVLSFGHIINSENQHLSHMKWERNSRSVIDYKGQLLLDQDNKIYEGQWTFQVDRHRVKSIFSHKSSLKTHWSVEYNDELLVNFAVLTDSNQYRCSFTYGRDNKIYVILSKYWDSVEAGIDSESFKYHLRAQMIKEERQLQIFGKINNVDQFEWIMNFKDQLKIITKYYGKQFSIMISPNGIRVEGNWPYRVVASASIKQQTIYGQIEINNFALRWESSYEYKPGEMLTVFFKATTKQQIHTINLSLTKKSMSLNYNDYLISAEFQLKPEIKILITNTFLNLKSLQVEANFQSKGNSYLKLKLDKLWEMEVNYKITQDQLEMKIWSKYINQVESLLLTGKKEFKEDNGIWTSELTYNDAWNCKMLLVIEPTRIAGKMQTNKGQIITISYEKLKREFILSCGDNDRFFNIIQKTRISQKDGQDFLIINTKLESSLHSMYRVEHVMKYLMGHSDKYLSNELIFNNHNLELKMHLQNQKELKLSLKINKNEYLLTFKKSTNNKDLLIAGSSPYGDAEIQLSNQDKLKFVKILLNKRSFLEVTAERPSDRFDIKFIVLYYSRTVLHISIREDRGTVNVDMQVPYQAKLLVSSTEETNDIKTWKARGQYQEYVYGIEASYLNKNGMKLMKVALENQYHVIAMSCIKDKRIKHEIKFSLVNKKSSKSWELTQLTTDKGRVIVMLVSPERSGKIEYQFDVNEWFLNVFDAVEVNARSTQGYLKIFGKKIADVKKDEKSVEARFYNNEKEELVLKVKSLSKGEWSKDYNSEFMFSLSQSNMNLLFEIQKKSVKTATTFQCQTLMKYQKMNGQIKELKFGYDLDWSKSNELTFNFEHPAFPMKFTLTRSYKDDKLKYQLNVQLRDNMSLYAFYSLEFGRNPGISSRIYYNPLDQVNEFAEAHIKFINNRHFQARVYTNDQKSQTDYLLLSLNLINSKTIKVEIKRNNQILKHISGYKRYFGDLIQSYMWQFYEDLSKEIKPELKPRYHQLLQLIPDLKTIQIQPPILIKLLRKEAKTFEREVNFILAKNCFYINTFKNTVQDYMRSIDYFVRDTFRFIRYRLEDILSSLTFQLNSFLKKLLVPYKMVYKFCINRLNRIIRSISLYDMTRYCYSLVIDATESYFSYIKYIIERSIARYHYIRSFFSRIILDTSIDIFEKIINFMKFQLREPLMKISNHLLENKRIGHLYVEAVNFIERCTIQMKDQLKMINNGLGYFSLEQMLQEYFPFDMEQVFIYLKSSQVKTTVANRISGAIEYYLRMSSYDWTNYLMDSYWPDILDIEENKLTRETYSAKLYFYSPIPWKDLQSTPDFHYAVRKFQRFSRKLGNIKKLIVQRTINYRNLFGYLNWFIPSFPQTRASFKSLVPEFQNYATLISSSVVTFDKQSFKLLQHPCKITLAEDLLYKKWSVILTQQGKTKKYQIKLGDKLLDINSQTNEVKLNGKHIELPYNEDSWSFVAFGRILTLKDEKYSLSVTIDGKNDILTVGISKWYHNKVRGLFGNNDNEPYNDLEMANSLSKSQGCKLKLSYKRYKNQYKASSKSRDCPFLRKLACKFIYKCPFSPMAACFKAVDPSSYFTQCINSGEELSLKLDKHVCGSARSYQKNCVAVGINVQLPLPCRKCEIEGRSVLINEKTQVKYHKKPAAEIVFILNEQNSCLKQIKNGLKPLVSTVDKNMRNRGMKSVKFGILGYAGNDVEFGEGHTHTIQSKLMNNQQETIKIMKSIIENINSINFEYKLDRKSIEETIKRAIYQYPWSDYSSKQIVMINCKDFINLDSYSSNLKDDLVSRNIELSLFTNLQDSVKNLIGYDKKQTFFFTETKSSDSALLAANKGFYQLAIDTNGLVYDSSVLLTNSKEVIIQSFASQLSRRATPSKLSECKCLDDGVHTCHSIEKYSFLSFNKKARI